jgi:8-oxo-dGTP pyrophosphatase MutT (NUDIX family)
MSRDVRDDQLPRGAGTAAEVVPRRAASVLVLRGDPVEVLMIRRVETSSFVPSAWVFPGGVVDQIDEEIARETGDGSELATMRIAALRELFEETGVWIGPVPQDAERKRRRLLAGTMTVRHLLEESPVDFDSLVWTSRWITPIGVPKRFDTWFFLMEADASAQATAHAEEAADLTWITPADALARHEAGDFPMVFPTIRNLEEIAGATSPRALLESRRSATIPTILPRLVVGPDGQKRIVLPE